jgi:hypothetical protein
VNCEPAEQGQRAIVTLADGRSTEFTFVDEGEFQEGIVLAVDAFSQGSFASRTPSGG